MAQGRKVLRIAMTAADIPTAHGIPNNGFEGYRFLGYPPYDGLVNWDLRHNRTSRRPSSLVWRRPGIRTKPIRCAGFPPSARALFSMMAPDSMPTR